MPSYGSLDDACVPFPRRLSLLLPLLVLLLLPCLQCAERDLVVTVTACGKKARYHAPSFLQSLIMQPAATRRRLALHVFGDIEAHRLFVGMGCFAILEPLFGEVVFHNMTAFAPSSSNGSSLSLLGQYWSEDQSRYSCASFKLDMLNMVPRTTSRIIYMDIDTVVFGDLAELYSKAFEAQPGKTLYAALESYRIARGWYADPKHSRRGDRKRQFLPPTGLNSGVLLMDLDRMRRTTPPLDAQAFLEANKEVISMGDQDVINSWAYHNPHEVGVLPCRWNRRSDSDCASLDDVAAAPTNAAYKYSGFAQFAAAGGLLHASRRVFMRHVVFPSHYELHANLTAAFLRSCPGLAPLLAFTKRGNTVHIP